MMDMEDTEDTVLTKDWAEMKSSGITQTLPSTIPFSYSKLQVIPDKFLQLDLLIDGKDYLTFLKHKGIYDLFLLVLP